MSVCACGGCVHGCVCVYTCAVSFDMLYVRVLTFTCLNLCIPSRVLSGARAHTHTLCPLCQMTKTIKKLEKENLTLRHKREKAELRMIDMQEDRNKLRRQLDLFQSRNQRLEQLCRVLQADRKKPGSTAAAPANTAANATASQSHPSEK
jgi:Myosin-like coiled-coil protein